MSGFDKFTIIKDGEFAQMLGTYFRSLMAAGFTREEAMTIVTTMIKGAMNIGKD